MIYSVFRKRHWTIEVKKLRDGMGRVYWAWVGAVANRPVNPPVHGWAAGGWKDAKAEAIMDIDSLDGKPQLPGDRSVIFSKGE